MADARAVGGRAHDEVAAEGHAERGCALHAEVVQHCARRALPLWLERHTRQRRVSLPRPIERDDVEWTGGEVGREVNDLLRIPVESVHHDKCVRCARGGLRAGIRVCLPAHRGELAIPVGDRVTGEGEAVARLVECGRHGVDGAALAGVGGGDVEGCQLVEAPRGLRVAFGIEALRERVGKCRDVLRRANARERSVGDACDALVIKQGSEGPIELEIELPVARVVSEHASRLRTGTTIGSRQYRMKCPLADAYFEKSRVSSQTQGK